MAMQGMTSAPARNQISAADKPSKIKVSGASKSIATSEGAAPVAAGPAIQGFGKGSGSGVTSTMGRAPVTSGSGVQGFSGTGVINGKI